MKRSFGSAMLSAIAELCHQRRLLAATRLAAFPPVCVGKSSEGLWAKPPAKFVESIPPAQWVERIRSPDPDPTDKP